MRPEFPPEGPRFITVDLEVWSREDLAALAAAAVTPRSSVGYSGKIRRKFLVSLNASSARRARSETPERNIWALLEVIEALPRPAARQWKRAESRVFNVGYEGGELVNLLVERPVGSGRWYPKVPSKAARVYETSFSPALLRAVAKVEGTIATTIYPGTKQVSSRRRSDKKAPRP